MKRALLFTSAVGLCLAAPAFAQTPTEPVPAPQAAPAQTQSSQPAASEQDRQRNRRDQDRQKQSGDANKQQPASAQAPASSSQPSSSAQAPASNEKPSSAAQAPAQQPAAGANQRQERQDQRAGDRPQRQEQRASDRQQRQDQRASDRQQRQDQRASDRQQRQEQRTGDRQQSQDQRAGRGAQGISAEANVNLNETQRTRIAATLTTGNVRPVSVNFRVATGVVVPARITLAPLPSTIVEIVPQYRGYRYFVTHEEIVIVEPRTKRIVTVLPAGGKARAQAGSSAKVSFTDQQRQAIRSRAQSLRSTTTTGSSSRIMIEQEVPAAIELEEFPAEIVTEVPTVREYRYIRQGDEVLVIEPRERRVIEIIR